VGGVNLPEPAGQQLHHIGGIHRRGVAGFWPAVEGAGLCQPPDGEVQQGNGIPHAVTVLFAFPRHGQQRIDGLPGRGLDAADGARDQFTTGQAVGAARKSGRRNQRCAVASLTPAFAAAAACVGSVSS
jgi:hypothetical protein